MRKQIIGLNQQFHIPGVCISWAAVLALLLPYVSLEGTTYSYITLLPRLLSDGVSFMEIAVLLAVAFTVIAAVVAAVTAFRPSIRGIRIWAAAAVVPTVCSSILVFGSKAMLDAAGILPAAFLVKYFGMGFWLLLICSYVSLACAMKTAKINVGYILLTVMVVVWLFPITFIVLAAFREEGGFYVGYFFPKGYTLDNFIALFTNESVIPFAKWWLNTFYVASCSCVLCTLIILATAYTLSRIRFKSRDLLMRIMLIIGMFPGFMSMIAVYNILKGLGMAQSLSALIVVNAGGAAMGYYICKGYFDTISRSIDEAAVIDGATRWQIFTRITIPLSKPIIIYTALSSFLGPWGDYIFPSMLLGDNQSSYTVAIGLKWLTDSQRIDTYYTQFAAGAVLVSIPIVILFIALQRFYVEGLSGSVKG